MATNDGDQNASTMHCSFCGKNRDQVAKLIQGPGNVFICDECIDACSSIIMESELNVQQAPIPIRAQRAAGSHPRDGHRRAPHPP